MSDLERRNCWIFDLDGTLTVAAHDFEAIRQQLGLAPRQPILEAIAARPADEAERLSRELDDIELEIARGSRAQEGAADLLRALRERGHRVGILTRNSEPNAVATLQACGLLEHFERPHIVGRDSSPPKPSPAGVRLLLRRFRAVPARAVVIGDSHYDLEAARAAGAAAVYFDAEASQRWDALADHRVERLCELMGAVRASRL